MTAVYVNTAIAGPFVWLVLALAVAAMGAGPLLAWLQARRFSWKRVAIVSLLVLAILVYSAQRAYAVIWCCCEDWWCWFVLP